MKSRLLGALSIVVLIAGITGLLRLARVPSDGAGAAAAAAGRTAWGDPDLQGIWTDPYQTPLQRPPQFASKEVFTDQERAALDRAARGDPSSRPARGAGQRARRRRRLQRRVPVGAADRQAHVARRRSPRRQASTLDRGCHQAERGGARVQAGAAAADRNLQEGRCRLRRWQVRAGVTAAKRAAAPLQHRAPQPERRPRGSQPDRALHRCRAARLRRLSAHRAVARGGLDLLRHRSRAGLAARDPGRLQSPSAVVDSPALRRLARPLGGRHAGRRRHQLLAEVQLSGGAREPAPRRAVQAPRRQHDRVLGDGGGSDHLDAAVDGEAGARRSRTSRPTGSTTSRAATRATTGCRRCSLARASKSARSAGARGRTRRPRTRRPTSATRVAWTR